MDVEQPGRHRSITDAPPAHWPAKTRRLIEETRRLCRDWLPGPLRQCLADFDRALHEQAARARSHLDQQRYQATRQRLVQERQAFEERFIDCIDQRLMQMGAPSVVAEAPAARLTLSLLDPLEHELTAALDQLVARSAARGGPLLVELGYRLAVLVGVPPLDGEAMPLGPQAMVKAFRDSSAALGLPAEHHLLLLQAVEGKLIQGLTPLHEVVNSHLAAAGILPRLRPFPLPRAPRQPRRQRPLPAAPVPGPAAAAHAGSDLRDLLARQHGPRPVDAHARYADPDELQAALAALQTSHPADPGLLQHARRLRERLVDQLNAGQPIDAVPILPGPQADDALVLVVRLFDALHRQLPGAAAHALLDRTQLPILRAAVADGTFFERREHPARLLLEQLLVVARDWLDEGDIGLLAALEPWLARLDRELPDPALYAEAVAELDRQLAQWQRKAQAAERRHVEAMQGRERLEQVRQRAGELLAGLLAKAQPSATLRTLLEHAWSDVLALTLLRHGEQSETFARRLVITDQLLGRLPPGNLGTLQAEVEAGLQQIGMHGEEASHIAQRLIGAGAVLHDADGPGLTGLAMRLKQRRAPGEAVDTAQTAPAALSAEALRLHQRLGQHAGAWFEFTEPDGRRVRRKLAWYSTRAARGLLVTRQGQRCGEISLAELAQALAAGKVREVPAVNESDLDRAWRMLADSLRQAGPIPGARS
jgi:hypothetical protein